MAVGAARRLPAYANTGRSAFSASAWKRGSRVAASPLTDIGTVNGSSEPPGTAASARASMAFRSAADSDTFCCGRRWWRHGCERRA